jgi:histone deacetylase complex regulatory component SIN3
MKQKDLEWRQVRVDMAHQWRKINELNYQKSLDHRSFYFKQEDRLRLAPRALQLEIRERHAVLFGRQVGLITHVASVYHYSFTFASKLSFFIHSFVPL